MIYICEYDHSSPAALLQESAVHLPLPQEAWAGEERKNKKKRERILAWLLLGYGLKQEYPELPDLEKGLFSVLDIRRSEHGKPYSAAFPEIRFNISHCETACACIIGAEPAGVDIERRFEFRENLFRRVCHPSELALLEKMDQEQKEVQFRLLWSLKESFVKWDGRGLGYGLKQIDLSGILPVNTGKEAEKSCEWLEQDGLFYLAGCRERYTVAACSSGGKARKMQANIRILQEKDLTGKDLIKRS